MAAGLTRFTANPSESCPAVTLDVPVTVAARPSVQAGRVVTLVDVCNMTSECGCLRQTWVVGERWGVVLSLMCQPHISGHYAPHHHQGLVGWNGVKWGGVESGGAGWSACGLSCLLQGAQYLLSTHCRITYSPFHSIDNVTISLFMYTLISLSLF